MNDVQKYLAYNAEYYTFFPGEIVTMGGSKGFISTQLRATPGESYLSGYHFILGDIALVISVIPNVSSDVKYSKFDNIFVCINNNGLGWIRANFLKRV